MPNKPTLDKTYLKLAKEWHPTKNGDLKPSNFTYGSDKKFWWLCNNCSHEEC